MKTAECRECTSPMVRSESIKVGLCSDCRSVNRPWKSVNELSQLRDVGADEIRKDEVLR